MDIIQVELLFWFFFWIVFIFWDFWKKNPTTQTKPNQNQLISTNVERYDKGIAWQRDYIPATAEGSTTFVFVQEARTELGIIQVSAESYFAALVGRSGAAAQCLPCAKQSIPSLLFWIWCHSLYKEKTLIKSLLVFCSLGFFPPCWSSEGLYNTKADILLVGLSRTKY